MSWRASPAELLASDADHPLLKDYHGGLVVVRRGNLTETSVRLLTEQMQTHDLAGFGCQILPAALCAAGCLLQYAKKHARCVLMCAPQVER